MCYHEDWLYGWKEKDAVRRRARRNSMDTARDPVPPAKPQPRPIDAGAAARPSETEVEEVV